MNSLDLFLNDDSKVCIYYGGAGKGSTMTGILKLRKYIEQGKSCAVVMRNGKDLAVSGGIIECAMKEFSGVTLLSKRLMVFDNKATITFLTVDELDKTKFDCMFIDNVNQIDETFDIDYLKSRCDVLWMSSNSTKTRGFVFETLKPYLNKKDNFYIPNSTTIKIGGVNFIHGTCEDNKNLLQAVPDYKKHLLSLPRDSRNSLLNGYFVEKN